MIPPPHLSEFFLYNLLKMLIIFFIVVDKVLYNKNRTKNIVDCFTVVGIQLYIGIQYSLVYRIDSETMCIEN